MNKKPTELENKPTFGFDAFELVSRFSKEDDEPTRPEDFGPYRFLDDKPLGSGSLGDVWLAEEQGDLDAGRKVAVKLLRRIDNKHLAANEVQSQSKLISRYIATLYNHGVLEDGTPWLAMEFVDGQPLDEYWQTGDYTIKQRLRLFHAVCEAVAYAHSEKIDHGDLKPSNILVKSNGEPKLLDFGLARRLHMGPHSLAQAQAVLGLTPAYAAPEQFRGESTGFRSDVYSLGVILYELLAGVLPFDLSRHTLAEIVDLKTGAHKPAEPSLAFKQTIGSGTNRYRELSKDQWRDLDALCLKAMAGDVKERYPSVETLLQELDRFGSSQPLQARLPHPWTYICGKFINRYRRVIVAACVAFLFAASGVGIYTSQLAKARSAALAEAERTQKVGQFFMDAFNHAAEDALPAEKSRIVRLFLDRGTKDAAFLRQDPAMQADIYQSFGTMYEKWGELDRGERLMREAMAIAEKHLPKHDSQLVKIKLALGALLNDRGAYNQAIEIDNELLKVAPEKSEGRAATTLLADSHFYLGHMALADSLYRKALAADRQINGQRQPEIADDLMNLGNVQLAQGNYPQSESYFRQALAINQSWFGQDSPEAADSASYVAQALYFQGGHKAEEVSLLNHALAALERAHGEIDIRVAFTVAQMGAVAIELNNLDEAEADFNRAGSIYRAVKGDDHQTVTTELANVASIYLAKKEYVRAELSFRDVIRRYERVLPADNYNIGIARVKLGHCLIGENRYRDSEVQLLKGHEILAKQAGSSVSWLKTACKDLVTAYKAMGQPDKSLRFQTELEVKAK